MDLRAKTVVLTGTFASMRRAEAEEALRRLGVNISGKTLVRLALAEGAKRATFLEAEELAIVKRALEA